MNESDRAAFYEAEEEYDALGLDAATLDEIEDRWLRGDKATASKLLRDKSDLTLAEARKLLARVYDGGS
jgi:hypothetical protein